MPVCARCFGLYIAGTTGLLLAAAGVAGRWSVVANRALLAVAALPVAITVALEWGESAFLVPASALVPGENWLCLRFSREWPFEDGLRAAAAVSTLQLP